MNKAQNRDMGKERRQGSKTPQKTNNNIIKDLVDSEADESPAADMRRMLIIMFNELKRSLKKTYKNNSMNHKRTWIKNLRRYRSN
jgi:hypothetical protein